MRKIWPKRTQWLMVSGLSLAAMGSVTARAGQCPAKLKPGLSCHTIRPSLELVTQGASLFAPIQNYSGYAWHEGEAHIPPPAKQNATISAKPGLELRIGAGGWGDGAKEPMAIARMTMAYTTDQGVDFLLPPSKVGYGYDFPCQPDTQLCYLESDGSRYHIWTPTSALVNRAYRITKINPAPLPSSVKQVPILVDYRMATHVEGTREQGLRVRIGVCQVSSRPPRERQSAPKTTLSSDWRRARVTRCC